MDDQAPEPDARYPRRWRVGIQMTIVILAIVVWFTSRSHSPHSSGSGRGSEDRGVDEFHCTPSTVGRHPAIIMLHGAALCPTDLEQFHEMCRALADRGFYAEFVEYYDAASYADLTIDEAETFRAWFGAIHSTLDALDKSPTVDPKRIAMMGFSQGAYLATGCGAMFPDQVAAVVEYYGGLIPPLRDRAKLMPPTLILHGARDSIIPVAEATDLDKLLTAAGRPHEIHIYPDADHGFNFRADGDRYNKIVADDAWRRSLKFLEETLQKRD